MVFILLKPIVNLYLFSYFIDFMKINFETLVSVFIRVPWISEERMWASERASERLNLTAFLGTADSEVHISCVIVAYTLESLSSLT